MRILMMTFPLIATDGNDATDTDDESMDGRQQRRPDVNVVMHNTPKRYQSDDRINKRILPITVK